MLCVLAAQKSRCEHHLRLLKKPPDGCGGEAGGCGGGSVDTSQWLITPEWVTWVKVCDDQRPGTPSD